MSKSEIKTGLIISSLIILAALSRLVDHPMNFTPMTAILLFSTAYITNKWLKLIFPFATILFTDMVLEAVTGYGFHSGSSVVYLGYAFIFGIGYLFLQKVNVGRTLVSVFLSSIVFYLITNFAFFYPESEVSNPTIGAYPHNFSGLIGSYQAGLPFFRNMLVGDLTFTTIVFGSYYLIRNLGLKTINN
ncbi:MAG: hypothetical protein K9I84_12455 [Leadbetterella sp.]|jgi:hypothetical protein|nr:hypothetical protein [Leadbetterella sp.]